MHIFKQIVRGLTLMALLAAPAALPASASALSVAPSAVVADSVSDACAGIGLSGASCKGNAGGTKISGVVKTLVNLLTAIVGVAAVIMIIIGGFKYVTSGGDSNSVASAKNTVIYAVVGLVVAAMAQLIVHFAIKSAG